MEKFDDISHYRSLVEQGAINATINPIGDTLIHEAARRGHKEIVQYLADNGAEIKPNLLGRRPEDVATDPEIKLFLEVLPDAREAMRFAHLVFNDPSNISSENHNKITASMEDRQNLTKKGLPVHDKLKMVFPYTQSSGKMLFGNEIDYQFFALYGTLRFAFDGVYAIQKSVEHGIRNATCGTTTFAGGLYMLSYTEIPEKFQISNIKLMIGNAGHQFIVLTKKPEELAKTSFHETVIGLRNLPFVCFDPLSKEIKMASQIPEVASANAVKNMRQNPSSGNVDYVAYDLGKTFSVEGENIVLTREHFQITGAGKDNKPKTVDASLFYDLFRELVRDSLTVLTPFVQQLQEQRATKRG